jgi:hypothetical protein
MVMTETIFIIGVVAAAPTCLTARDGWGFCRLMGRMADSRIQLLPSSWWKLVFALTLTVARSTSGRGNIGAAAKRVVQRRGRGATMGNVGHFSKSHQLNGNVFVLFRHGTSDRGIGSGEDAAHAVVEANAVRSVSNAASMAATVRHGRRIYALAKAIAIALGRLKRAWVYKGVRPSGQI